MANGEISTADSNAPLPYLPEKNQNTDTFEYNEKLLLISLYQKYEAFSVIFFFKKKANMQMTAKD